MAQFYWHDFMPSFSGMVLVALFLLIDIAFITGWRSVRIRPRKVRKEGQEKYPDCPKFKSTKAARVREQFDRDLMREAKLADSVICFCSKTRDALWSLAGGVAFAIIFAKAHWYGMVQWVINHLAANEGAAWGDIVAYIGLVVIGGAAACGFWVVRDFAQWFKACRETGKYLYDLNKRIIIVEAPTLDHYFNCIKWLITTTIEEKKAKEAEKRRRELHRTKKPYNCEIIKIDDRRAI